MDYIAKTAMSVFAALWLMCGFINIGSLIGHDMIHPNSQMSGEDYWVDFLFGPIGLGIIMQGDSVRPLQ